MKKKDVEDVFFAGVFLLAPHQVLMKWIDAKNFFTLMTS